jgi:hypothetical protein
MARIVFLSATLLGVAAIVAGATLGATGSGIGGLLVGIAGATFAGLGSVGELRHRSSSAIRLEEDKAAAELAERAQLQHEDSLATSPSLAHSGTLRFGSVALWTRLIGVKCGEVKMTWEYSTGAHLNISILTLRRITCMTTGGPALKSRCAS